MGPCVAGTRRPSLNAAGNDAAIEELTLAHEGPPIALPAHSARGYDMNSIDDIMKSMYKK